MWRAACLHGQRMRLNRRTETASDAATAFVTEGSELEGTCSFSGSVVIAGQVKGTIEATGTLSIARSGRVEARLRAPVVLVEGEVIGSIVATERIELREHARVRGDLETPALVIEENALFEGHTRRVRAPREALADGEDLDAIRPAPTLALS